MESTQHGEVTGGTRTTEEVRDELFRILDELVTARSDRTAALSARFRALWDEVKGKDAPTLH